MMPPGRLHWALVAVGVFFSAIAINMLVLLLHEGMHGTLFSSRFWNRWVSVLLGASFLMSFSAYQVMHLRHHNYLGDPRDPDDYVNYTTRPRLLWLMHFLRLIFGRVSVSVFNPDTGDQERRARSASADRGRVRDLAGDSRFRDRSCAWRSLALGMGSACGPGRLYDQPPWIRAARHRSRVRPFHGQSNHAAASARRLLFAERELPPRTSPVPRSA